MTGGWTKTPNKIYEAMAGMCEAELRVTMVVVRATYGFRRDYAELQYEDFMIEGGLKSRASVAKGIKLMLRRGFFKKGKGQSDYVIPAKNSLVNELSESENSSPDEPKNSTVDEPLQLYKEKDKEREESKDHIPPLSPPPVETMPFVPVKNKSRAPKSPADERVDAVLDVCGMRREVDTHLRQAEQVAAELKPFTAADIYGHYEPVENPNGHWNWFVDDWRGQKGQQPKPREIVETISKKRVKVKRESRADKSTKRQTAADSYQEVFGS